ncbi:hypothetical protein DRQ09_08070 [candidate division KSB1 bacterium]|nr:MAG: hypothetical protein DRQ09_08070 [candidate division KSB1 bacterium]
MIDFKKLMVVIYVIAAISAIFLCSKMIGTINKTIKPEKIVYAKMDNLNLRVDPSEGSMVIITVKKGDKLIFLEEKGEWIKVATGSFSGYVKKENISESPVK